MERVATVDLLVIDDLGAETGFIGTDKVNELHATHSVRADEPQTRQVNDYHNEPEYPWLR